MNQNTRRFRDYCIDHRFRESDEVSSPHDFLVNYIVSNPPYLGFEKPLFSTRGVVFIARRDRDGFDPRAGMEIPRRERFLVDFVIMDDDGVPWFGRVKSGTKRGKKSRTFVSKVRRVGQAFGIQRVGVLSYRTPDDDTAILRRKRFDAEGFYFSMGGFRLLQLQLLLGYRIFKASKK